jgi:anti-anti-sigma factor
MQVTCELDTVLEGVLLAKPAGPLDLLTLDGFWEVVSSSLGEGASSMVVDMADVERIDSAGVGGLIRLLHHLHGRGGQLAVYGCNDRVGQVLRICELESILNVHDTLGEARRSLS